MVLLCTLRNPKGDCCDRARIGTELRTLQKCYSDFCYGRQLRHVVLNHNIVGIVWNKWGGLAIEGDVYAAGASTALTVDQLHFINARCQGIIPFWTRSLLTGHT